LVARYDQIQTPVDAVHVQSSVNEETPTGKVTEREGMLLDVSLSGVTSEELPANRYKVPDDKTRKVQQPFDWVALTDHN
jgi:predicted nucleotidyltransferase